jgi:hypothetical protein
MTIKDIKHLFWNTHGADLTFIVLWDTKQHKDILNGRTGEYLKGTTEFDDYTVERISTYNNRAQDIAELVLDVSKGE